MVTSLWMLKELTGVFWFHTGHEEQSPELKSFASLTETSTPNLLPI